MTHSLVAAARSGLAELADPARAEDMRAYMKSDMPFRGVQKPARRRLGRTLFTRHPLPDADTLRRIVRELWHEARFREERYLAIDLTGFRRYRDWQKPDLLPLYEELIVTGARWDFVDELAIRRVGPLLRASPAAVAPRMRSWAGDGDLWRRRAAVICQVTAKTATDSHLLADVIEATIADADFFLRKVIGWALRDYAKTDPDWVRSFVAAHPELSVLSTREALKHVTTRRPGGAPPRSP